MLASGLTAGTNDIGVSLSPKGRAVTGGAGVDMARALFLYLIRSRGSGHWWA